MTNTSAERAAVSRIRAENRAANAAVRATNTSSAPSSSSGSSSSSSSGSRSSRILTEEENIAMIKAPIGTIVDVGAATRAGIITPQEAAKIEYLQRGTGQWRTGEEFKEKVASVPAFLGEARGVIVSSVPSPPLPNVNTPNAAWNPTGNRPSLLQPSQDNRPETKYDPKYGTMIRSDIAEAARSDREQRMLKSALPSGLAPSFVSRKSVEYSQEISKRIRDIRISTGYSGGDYVLGLGKESTARLAEFGGMIIPTTELLGKTAITRPSAIPKMAVLGGLSFVGGIAKQAKENPAQFVSDIVVTAGIFKGMGKISSKATETIKFTGKRFVSPESIIEPQVLSGAERFPLAPRGTTAKQLINEFKTSPYRLPGTELKTGGWHATPQEFAKNTLTQAGTSEGKGLYIAPSTSPHFWKIGSNYKLFGWDAPPESPTGIWLETSGIKRSPPNTRFNIEAQNRFLMGKAPKGTAFISSAFEKGIKPEKEAIIPPETPIRRVSNKFYTVFKGKKVALMEYTARQPKPIKSTIFKAREVGPGIGAFWKGKTPSSGMVTFKAGIISPSNAVKVVGVSIAAPQPKEETWGEVSRRQSRISKEYAKYKEPIITPSSLTASLSRSSLRSSSVSFIKSSMKSSQVKSNQFSRSISSISSRIKSPTKSSLTGSLSSSRSKTSYQTYPAKSKYPIKYPPYPIKTASPPTPPMKPPKTPKIKLPKLRFGRTRFKKPRFGKFPELARVATARQVWGRL